MVIGAARCRTARGDERNLDRAMRVLSSRVPNWSSLSEGESNNGINMDACAVDQREFGRLLIVDQSKIRASQHDGLRAALVEQPPANLIED